jgi:hypothetical protein
MLDLSLNFVFEIRQLINRLIDFLEDGFLKLIARDDFGLNFVDDALD